MKQIVIAIVFSLTANSVFAQSYKEQLQKVNNYLKTFDNGYYGYLEIKDGYLYDRFPSGKYSKSEIKYLGEAVALDDESKVQINCLGGKDCVYSTYTDSYHGSVGFSQSSSFNKQELAGLLNNLLQAYKKGAGQESLSAKVNTTNNVEKTNSNPKMSGNFQTAMTALNNYLKTFDNGYYGYFELKDGYIYQRFKAGKYNKFRMEDMEGALVQEQYSRVIFKCKSGSCIATDWKVNGTEPYTQFTSSSTFNFQELADLLNDLRNTYFGGNNSVKANTYTTNDSIILYNKLKTAYDELNSHIITIDDGRYHGIDVENGYIISKYANQESSKARVEDIDFVQANTEYGYVKLGCKGGNKCVYSTITGSNHDYFNFNSSSSEIKKTERLLQNFLTTLKAYYVYETRKVSATTTTAKKSDGENIVDMMRRNKQQEKKAQPVVDNGSNWFSSLKGGLSAPSSGKN